MNITITTPSRLDKIEVPFSRARLQKMIRGGEVRVNGKVQRVPHFPLLVNAVVTLPDVTEAPVVEADSSSLSRYQTLYEDASMLVINKPIGIRVEAIIPVAQRNSLFLAHRLDKDTSGVLVIAKGIEALQALQQQWKKRSVQKTYIALVAGKMDTLTGKIQAGITRSRADRTRMAVSSRVRARASNTDFKVLQHFPTVNVTLLEAYPHTGRTHQIRVHFGAIGHPIMGDNKYGVIKTNKAFREEITPLTLHHQFLHAKQLELTSPATGAELKIEAPIPADLNQILTVLK